MHQPRSKNGTTLTRRAALRGMASAGAAMATGLLAQRAGATPMGTPPASPVPTGQVAIPDTAIGREFASWLAATNSQDPDQLLAHFTTYGPPDRAEGMAAVALVSARPWGELIVHRIEESSETRLRALLEATLNEEWLMIVMEHDADRVGISLQPVDPPPGALPGTPLDDAALAAEMTRYLDKLARADVFSGAVLIAREGVPLLTEARGLANSAVGTPNTPGTRFNLGSMNKMFTSVVVGQLVEAGQLAFSDPIARHLPDYPADVARKVTVEHLLTHTSGLGDIFGPRYDQAKESLHTLQDYLPLFVDEPLRFEPGSRHEYSNAGYIVLGLIIEALTGQDYFEVVRQRVHDPAGMSATDAVERDAATPDVATGYTYPLPPDPADLTLDDVLKGREPNDDFLAPRGTSAGGGYSTVEDLLRFDRAHHEATLLTPEMVATLIEGKVDAMMRGVRYGYGFIDDRSGPERIVGHSGGAPGISAKLDMYWDLDATVVALSNYDQAAEYVSMKARRLLSRG